MANEKNAIINYEGSQIVLYSDERTGLNLRAKLNALHRQTPRQGRLRGGIGRGDFHETTKVMPVAIPYECHPNNRTQTHQLHYMYQLLSSSLPQLHPMRY